MSKKPSKEELIELIKTLKKTSKIAEFLNVSYNTVVYYLRYYNLIIKEVIAKPIPTKDDILIALSLKGRIRDAAKHLGFKYSYICDLIKQYGIEIKRRKANIINCTNCNKQTKVIYNKRLFCSTSCCTEYKVKKNFEKDYALFIEGKLNNPGAIRRVMLKIKDYKCTLCGRRTWKGKSIVLWVDHADGNYRNNHPDNLRFVCLNCDAQQDTFCAKNYGKGRDFRYNWLIQL